MASMTEASEADGTATAQTTTPSGPSGRGLPGTVAGCVRNVTRTHGCLPDTRHQKLWPFATA
eukprot:7849103-Pyramimonas_sp.AAC.1